MLSEFPQLLALDDLRRGLALDDLRRGVLSLDLSSVDMADTVGLLLHAGMHAHVQYPLTSDELL